MLSVRRNIVEGLVAKFAIDFCRRSVFVVNVIWNHSLVTWSLATSKALPNRFAQSWVENLHHLVQHTYNTKWNKIDILRWKLLFSETFSLMVTQCFSVNWWPVAVLTIDCFMLRMFANHVALSSCQIRTGILVWIDEYFIWFWRIIF